MPDQLARTDVAVHNHGTTFRFEPLTAAASGWICQQVVSEAISAISWSGNDLVVSPHDAGPLVRGMMDDGLIVR